MARAVPYVLLVSIDQFVFLAKASLPTTDVWQGALDGLGIDVHLDESIETASHSGFWPVRCGTSQLGFEYYAGPVAEIFGGEPPVGIGVRDYVVNLVTHSDLQELRCALLAAAALAIETDGVVFDDETGGLTTGSSLLEEAGTIDPPT
jgi:hypothetical protein